MDLSAHLTASAHCSTVSIPFLCFLLITFASEAAAPCVSCPYIILHCAPGPLHMLFLLCATLLHLSPL